MAEVVWGLGLFAIALLLHVTVWRVRVPRAALPALVVVFGAAYALGLVGYLAAGQPSWAGWIYWSLLYAVLVCSYVLTYNGVAYDSPALALVYRLGQAGERGASAEELKTFFAERPFVRSRLNQMLRDGLLRNQDGRLVLAERSVRLLQTYDRARALLGRRFEGG